MVNDLAQFDLRYTDESEARARSIHQKFGIPIESKQASYHLNITPDQITLTCQDPSLKKAQSVPHPHVLSTQLIDQAIACPSGFTIIDTTAGFGLDAMHLARKGNQVIAIETHPIVYLLASQHQHPNLTWVWANCQKWLADHPWDFKTTVLYMDPMFDQGRKKSPKPHAWMQLLRQWQVPNGRHLYHYLFKIGQRIVVKQPVHAPIQLKPHHQIKGKTIRFDIYYRPLLGT